MVHASSTLISGKLPTKFELTWKSATTLLIFMGGVGVTAFWLYSDHHNDELFLTKVKYHEDQEQYRRDQKKIDKDLEEIKTDQRHLIDHLIKRGP